MGKQLLAAALGAVAMFVWGFVSWTVLNLHDVKSLSNSETVAESLRSSGDETGVYWIPAVPKSQDEDSAKYQQWVEAHERGPLAMVVYNKQGAPVLDPMTMVKGFLVMFAACLIVVTMLGNAGIHSFLGRVMFCTAFGLFTAVYAEGSSWAWFYFPMDWAISSVIDDVVSWAAAGVVMAAMVKPK